MEGAESGWYSWIQATYRSSVNMLYPFSNRLSNSYSSLGEKVGAIGSSLLITSSGSSLAVAGCEFSGWDSVEGVVWTWDSSTAASVSQDSSDASHYGTLSRITFGLTPVHRNPETTHSFRWPCFSEKGRKIETLNGPARMRKHILTASITPMDQSSSYHGGD